AWLNAATIVLGFSAISGRFVHLTHADLVPLPHWFLGIVYALAGLVAVLSVWPVHNMVSRRQLMNFSFNRYHFVNTYGAFGSITRMRNEIVIEGMSDETQWQAYEFKGKPGDPKRHPPQFAPYHL